MGAPEEPRFMPIGDHAQAAAAAPGPLVELGETTVWATVTVTWTLAEPPGAVMTVTACSRSRSSSGVRHL